jgi:biotin operon repressor
MTITRNPELHSLIPPLTPEEYAQLEANLVAEGCRDPLVLWQEKQILLDGHNRLAICEAHGLEYRMDYVSLPDLDAAKQWMITHQLGRRNLTPEQMRYFRGEQYNLLKRQGKRTDLTFPQSEEKFSSTSSVLAAQHKVGHATIERDGAYADAVNAITHTVGVELRQALLARDVKLTQQDSKLLATLVAQSPETAQAVKDALQSDAPAPVIKAIVTAARCAICHRPLSNPASVSRGIGPVCAGHGNGAGRASGGQVSVGPLASARARPTPAIVAGPAVDPPEAPLDLAALLSQALHTIAGVQTHLQAVSRPEALERHTEACIALGKACRRVEHLMTEHPAILNALSGRPPARPQTAPADPVPPAAPGAQRKAGALQARVWETLQQHQPCSNAQVAQVLGEERKHVHKALQSLVKQGKAHKQGQTYRVVPAPKGTAIADGVAEV